MTLAADGTVIAAWEEQEAGVRRVAIARSQADKAGASRFVRRIASDQTPAVYPVLASAPDAIVAAWTSGAAGQTVVKVARLPN